eukprot:TRINITY_DN95580_c0_g1_i1.p1 TRINITY_DN95580_c0_g1~~TRINITY_DN95580_c0_g1_i1.p1  ORF type:complete len:328 (+),score=56.48 TRINITY_DN95580_c0_g1_i1:85-1068(+)
MKMILSRCAAVLFTTCAALEHVLFDGNADSTKLEWEPETDEVMGGSSTGSFRHTGNGTTFQGECKTLPSPENAAGWFSVKADLSSPPALNGCFGIAITARTSSPYLGFRLSFGTDQWYSKHGYKAVFTVPVKAKASEEFATVQIPFENFTRAWDDTSGKAQISCDDDRSVCPTYVQLANIQNLQLWAEGVAGRFTLEVKSITAYDCAVQAKSHWDVKTACQQVCQPDPDYSKTEWCKHKDRGGCCVEVNPNWDTVPGYKHMSDFCDKLCMPDGPGKLAMCKPPPEYESLQATDPLDAIDRFYETNPEQCKNRIGDWAEANCENTLFA